MMARDGIDELAREIADAIPTRIVPMDRLIAVHLRAANVQLPPAPPLPGSLWGHKDGNVEFVLYVKDDFVHSAGVSANGKPSISDTRLSSWHAWAANATCLCDGKAVAGER